MAWGSCTRYYKLRKRGRGMEYPGAKGKTWLIDEALGRAVLRFPVFSENLKKKKKRRFLISVWLIHSGFSFPDFFGVEREEGEKNPPPILFGSLARLLSSPGKWFLQQTHLGSFTPIPDGSCQILPMAPHFQREKRARFACISLESGWVGRRTDNFSDNTFTAHLFVASFPYFPIFYHNSLFLFSSF